MTTRVGRDRLVALDARGYFTGGGVGRYTRNLIRELVSTRPSGMDLRLLISNRHVPDDLELAPDPGVEIVVSQAGWMESREEDRWLEAEVAGADLFHSLSGHWVPASPASVATLLDVTPIVRPDLFVDGGRLFGQVVNRTMSRASRVIAISKTTADDARRVLPVLPPMSVVPLAAEAVFAPSAGGSELLERNDITADEFTLAVSVLNPHKNLVRLIDAYAASGLPGPLLVVGAQREAADLIHQAIRRHRLDGRVRLVGRVSDAELARLYASCRMFVYPSLYEGFGLPVIEAMACGAAVIASLSSSIPEVAGDAALLVDPTSVDAWASALRAVDADTVLRDGLRRRGLARAATFSWAKTAAATLAVYDDILEARAA